MLCDLLRKVWPGNGYPVCTQKRLNPSAHTYDVSGRESTVLLMFVLQNTVVTKDSYLGKERAAKKREVRKGECWD